MKCFNRQFGEIEFEKEHVYEFAGGIIGFEHLKQFIIISDSAYEPFRWLVSIEDDDTSFPILDPSVVVEDYRIEIPDAHTHVAVVAALRDPAEQSTVNLRSPILFDTVQRRARQVVLDHEVYPVHHPLVQHLELAEGDERC